MAALATTGESGVNALYRLRYGEDLGLGEARANSGLAGPNVERVDAAVAPAENFYANVPPRGAVEAGYMGAGMTAHEWINRVRDAAQRPKSLEGGPLDPELSAAYSRHLQTWGAEFSKYADQRGFVKENLDGNKGEILGGLLSADARRVADMVSGWLGGSTTGAYDYVMGYANERSQLVSRELGDAGEEYAWLARAAGLQRAMMVAELTPLKEVRGADGRSLAEVQLELQGIMAKHRGDFQGDDLDTIVKYLAISDNDVVQSAPLNGLPRGRAFGH